MRAKMAVAVALAAAVTSACGGGSNDANVGDASSNDAGVEAATSDAAANETTWSADAADASDANRCRSCLTATGAYESTPLTFDCDFDHPNATFTTADNVFADSYDTWILRCVSTDGSRIVNVWFNAGSAAGSQDFANADTNGVHLYGADPSDTYRYLNSSAPNLVKNHVEWDTPTKGHVRGRFEAEWSNRSDGNPWGSVSGSFDVTK